jgi:SAM-dependent methyltransferase
VRIIETGTRSQDKTGEIGQRAEAAKGFSCPACGATGEPRVAEKFREYTLYECAECDLHFWHPVKMPDAAWYEIAYRSRDSTAMPLEPGHRFFLADAKAPKKGTLLDVGCGVGNFLAAAQSRGFTAAGTEFNPSAVQFAKSHYGLQDVHVMTPQEFRAAYPDRTFDVVTCFEVLEHQDDPQGFLNVLSQFVGERGFLTISVPNRTRWQKGTDTLDYPPNHLTRWSPRALSGFLSRNGFEVLSLRQEPLGVRRAALMLSMSLRTGLVKRVAGETPANLTDLAAMKPAEMEKTVQRMETDQGHRFASFLVRCKNLAMVPAAGIALPYLRMKGYTGLYLYCLARKTSAVGSGEPGKLQGD